jgi:phage terminase small subunit
MAEKRCRAPRGLSHATRAWWHAVDDGYDLEAHHRKLLTVACQTWDRLQEIRAVIAAEGIEVPGRFPGQRMAHPLLSAERQSAVAFARLIRELALDDASPPETRPPRLGGKE